jgi:hypothetical protein
MQKEDIQWMVLALGILVIISLVVAPITTGKPANLGISLNFSLPPLSPIQPLTIVTPPTTMATPATTPTPERTTITVTPTPVPTWNGSSVQTIQFVDPSTYGINLTESLLNSPKIPFDNASFRNTNLTTYATFSGQYSGTTQIISIPFPYWELWYTVEPFTAGLSKQSESGGLYIVRPTQGQGVSMSGYQGSYSTTLPKFNITVMDTEDPDRIVRIITPPGSLDPELWKVDTKTGRGDPRPWKEKFYEGQKNYYFIIKASLLKSYKIEIRVPSSYIGKFQL